VNFAKLAGNKTMESLPKKRSRKWLILVAVLGVLCTCGVLLSLISNNDDAPTTVSESDTDATPRPAATKVVAPPYSEFRQNFESMTDA
jgi:hypothetical protein